MARTTTTHSPITQARSVIRNIPYTIYCSKTALAGHIKTPYDVNWAGLCELEFTALLRVKLTNNFSEIGQNSRLISFEGGANARSFEVFGTIATDNILARITNGTSSQVINSGSPITSGDWISVGMYYKNSTRFGILINGNRINEVTPVISLVMQTYDMRLMCFENGLSPADGYVAEFYLLNRAIENDIEAEMLHYEGRIPSRMAAIIRYAPETGSGIDLFDQTHNEFDATLVGNASWSTDRPYIDRETTTRTTI